jgi:hypothetical protein
MSKLYSVEEYFEFLRENLQFDLVEISVYAEFDEWVESVNPAFLYDEERFDVWFNSLDEQDFQELADRLWKNSKLDDEIEQAQEKSFISNLEIDRGEMLLENLKEMEYVRI